MALYLIQEHLSNLTSTIVIAEHSSIPEYENTNAQLLDYILQNLQGSISVQLYVRGVCHQPLEYYVFIVDSTEAFRTLFRYFVDTPFERHYRFLIFLTKFSPGGYFYHLAEIFKLCYQFDIIDVSVVSDRGDLGFEIYIYHLFAAHLCRRYFPEPLITFDLDPENLQFEIFPNKLKNLFGCPFKVSARIYPPYFTFIGNKTNPEPEGDWDNISGIEGSLLKFLAETINFSIDLKPFPKERSFFKNNKSSGCFKQIKDRDVDIIVGGFVDSVEGRFGFSPTGQYHNSAFRYIVRGKNYLSSLDRLAKPFSKQTWILVAGFLVVTIVFTSVLKLVRLKIYQIIFGEENQNPVTNILAICLGYSVSRIPRRNFARFILLQMLILTLVLRNAYQGSLYDAFRMDKFAQIPSGLNDLNKWNYTILLPAESSESLMFPNERTIKTKTYGYEPRLQMLERLEGKYVTVAFQDSFIYYVERNLKHKIELLSIKEVIYNYQFVMYLPKHSIFLPTFNKKLRDLAAAGILTQLRLKFTRNDQFLSAFSRQQQQKKKPLNNKRLYAVYNICGVLLGISIVVFCLEILSVRFVRLKRMFG
ncbi:uncharacterized protein LOC129920930 [Episyrphus balteatus]|uniref:uncharacterized protein LOC129920930 n=1 Tax=Episyrphus balteatus TaxID=286459 RepID=UPI002484E708|nr:uncharacterized protein LOC129920930 [Episyrphus balteatus]